MQLQMIVTISQYRWLTLPVIAIRTPAAGPSLAGERSKENWLFLSKEEGGLPQKGQI